MTMTTSIEDIRRVADEVAKATVRETLLRLGVDEEEEGAFSELRADLQYARKLRKASDTVSTAGLWAIVGILASATIGAIWLGIVTIFHGASP